MNGKLIVGILGMLVVAGGIVGYNAQTQPICAGAQEYITTLGTGTNQKFSIVLPNGDSKCDIVLSNDNFTKLKNNVGVFRVGDMIKNTNEPINTNYCGLAKWIFIGHLNYYDDVIKKYENYMFPRECTTEVWPDLGLPQWYLKVWNWYEGDLVSEQEIINGLRYITSL